jgi:hypothetical protein
MAEKNKSVPVCLSQNELFIMNQLLKEYLNSLVDKKISKRSKQYKFSKRFRRKVKRHLKVNSCDYRYNAIVFVKTG